MPLPLLDYQELGAQALASRARFGLFDDPGVGKTCQAIRALDLRGADRNLIITPAVGRKNWRREFTKFSTRYRKICVGENIHDFVAWSHGRFDTLITSWDLAAKWAPKIAANCEILEGLVFDEAHNLRNHGTNRNLALLGPDEDGRNGLLQWAVQAWWLTGTPIWNDPSDIFPFLRGSGVMPLKRSDFNKRYFHSRSGAYNTTHSARRDMLPELRSLIANNSLRRTLDQTGINLPPLLAATYVVDGDTQAVRELLLAHPGLDDMIIQALEEGRSISNFDTDHVSTLRRLIGEAKAVPYAALLKEELGNGLDKMVVFGIHRAALATCAEIVRSAGYECATINGSTSSKADDAALERFNTDPTLRVLFGNIVAAGTVLTMTGACCVDMLESAWTDKANWQAIKRVHRFGQTRNVRARFISLADSFDETVTEIVARKASEAARLGH